MFDNRKVMADKLSVWSNKKQGTILNNFFCTLFDIKIGYGTGQNRLLGALNHKTTFCS
jgi:hypothetical protein